MCPWPNPKLLSLAFLDLISSCHSIEKHSIIKTFMFSTCSKYLYSDGAIMNFILTPYQRTTSKQRITN